MNEELRHALRTNPQQEFTFAPSRGKRWLLMIVCLLFALGSLFMVRENPAAGVVGALLFGGCAAIAANGLVPGREYFRLTREGFEVRTAFQKKSARWNDVRELGVMVWRRNRFIAWKCRAGGATWDGAIPDTYGFEVDELLEIMRERRATAK